MAETTVSSAAVASKVIPIRGAIKVAISTSTDTLVAGQDFSIFVTIRNPFEAPLVLHSIATYLPTELLDADKHLRDLQILDIEEQMAEMEDAKRAVGEPSNGFIRRRSPAWLPKRFRGLTAIVVRLFGLDAERQLGGGSGPTIARDLTTDAQLPIKIPASGSVTIGIRNPSAPMTDEQKKFYIRTLNDHLQQYQDALIALENVLTPPKTLQPGNSTTRAFTLRSKRAIWFRPASYRLQVEVEYAIGGLRNIDTIEHPLQVKASPTSMMLGSLLGGIGGWLTSRGGIAIMSGATVLNLTLSLGLAAIAVMLFARKKEVQPIITIEDFWGGIAFGFLVAYAAPKILATLMGKPL